MNFTQPTLTTATSFDTFFGVIFPAVVPATQVLRTDSHGGIGGSLGLGLTFALGMVGPSSSPKPVVSTPMSAPAFPSGWCQSRSEYGSKVKQEAVWAGDTNP